MSAPNDEAFFIEKVMAYREAKIILVANDVDLFTRLSGRRLDAEEMAAALGTDERATAALLNALVAIGLLDKDEGGRFANGAAAERYLVAGRPEYKGNNLKYQELIWDCWSRLGDVLRTGRPHRELWALLTGQSKAFVQEYIRGMHNIAGAPARAVAEAIDLSDARRMLDVGGGPGTFTMAFLDANPRLRGVILDLARTLEVTARTTADFPGRSRIRRRKGDYLRDGFGRNFDFVWISHVTHDESEATNRRLLDKAFSCLKRGGRVAVHDFVVDPSRTAPPFSAIFAVNMLVYTKGGNCYNREDYTRWMEDSGFRDVESFDVLCGQVPNWTAVVMGRK